jgi:hypothetical protein
VVTRLEAIIKKNNNTNVQPSFTGVYSCNSNRSSQRPISSFAKDFYSCNSSTSSQQPISNFAYSFNSSTSSQRRVTSNSDNEEIEQIIRSINNSL